MTVQTVTAPLKIVFCRGAPGSQVCHKYVGRDYQSQKQTRFDIWQNHDDWERAHAAITAGLDPIKLTSNRLPRSGRRWRTLAATHHALVLCGTTTGAGLGSGN
jgi:hypothetical protein